MKARAGFTLLEAIVALAVVSIVCIGVLAAQGSAFRAEAVAAARVPLAVIAEERLAALDLYDGPLARLPDSLAVGHLRGALAEVQFRTDVTPVQGHRDLFDVSVHVLRAADSVTLHTRRFRNAGVSP